MKTKKISAENNRFLAAKKWEKYALAHNFPSLDAFCQSYATRLEAETERTRQYSLREMIDVSLEGKTRSAIVNAVVNKIPEYWWDREANDIMSEEWDEWLVKQDLKPTSYNDYRSVIRRAYELALGRGRVVRNPINGIGRKSTKNSITQVDPLSPEEAEHLMRRCERLDPEMAPAFALMLFAGVRPDFEDGEIARLQWCDIDLEKLTFAVRGKGQEDWEKRVVKISDQLAAWLEAYRPLQDNVGVQPLNNVRRRREKILNGIREKGEQDDLLRKSFVCNSIAHFGREATIAQIGHSRYIVMERNYHVRAIDEESALRFFNIMPERK